MDSLEWLGSGNRTQILYVGCGLDSSSSGRGTMISVIYRRVPQICENYSLAEGLLDSKWLHRWVRRVRKHLWRLTVRRLTTHIWVFMGRTAPLTPKCCILYIYSPNVGTEYFKHSLYSPFFFSSKCSLFHNANLFGYCIIHILYTVCAEIKKNIYSGAKGLNSTSPFLNYYYYYYYCPILWEMVAK